MPAAVPLSSLGRPSGQLQPVSELLELALPLPTQARGELDEHPDPVTGCARAECVWTKTAEQVLDKAIEKQGTSETLH